MTEYFFPVADASRKQLLRGLDHFMYCVEPEVERFLRERAGHVERWARQARECKSDREAQGLLRRMFSTAHAARGLFAVYRDFLKNTTYGPGPVDFLAISREYGVAKPEVDSLVEFYDPLDRQPPVGYAPIALESASVSVVGDILDATARAVRGSEFRMTVAFNAWIEDVWVCVKNDTSTDREARSLTAARLPDESAVGHIQRMHNDFMQKSHPGVPDSVYLIVLTRQLLEEAMG